MFMFDFKSMNLIPIFILSSLAQMDQLKESPNPGERFDVPFSQTSVYDCLQNGFLLCKNKQNNALECIDMPKPPDESDDFICSDAFKY